MRVPWIADVLRGAGLAVVETPGWRGRGKEITSVDGVMVHHTASHPASTLATNLTVVTTGNAVAPGPIAQVMFWRDGVAYIIADGRANHAGAGGPWGGWLPEGQGNHRLIGFECVNSGVGEPWATEMVVAMEIGSAAVLRYLGHDASRCLFHHEYAPTRKIDPAGPNTRIALRPGDRSMRWVGDSFRARVTSWLEPAPPPPVTPDPPEAVRMFIIVGNADDRTDPRRWVWDGAVSMRLLGSEAEYHDLVNRAAVGLVALHPSFASLNDPFWMTTAERSLYGG